MATTAEHIKACAELGTVNHFVVMAPGDASRSLAENFDYMVESYTALAPVFAEHDARLVIEGYPGKGFLCCTPESYRLFFAACPSPAYGVNYDPSHLIRQGIDPIRFLHEFVDRVFHVHAKDTAIDAEAQYQLGHEHPATKTATPQWGGNHWRYTIPGHGIFPWAEGFDILAQAGYQGCVSVELEDVHFSGSEDDEKAGFTHSLRFLASC